ncbi:hypothetical protein RJ641_034576 [Dillenia turbinata]|uniref:Uncharacterized protein n=1 Tax=Dillenia turbinata TaxID=194707 RepID=A0AAN8VRE6_9MAGN
MFSFGSSVVASNKLLIHPPVVKWFIPTNFQTQYMTPFFAFFATLIKGALNISNKLKNGKQSSLKVRGTKQLGKLKAKSKVSCLFHYKEHKAKNSCELDLGIWPNPKSRPTYKANYPPKLEPKPPLFIKKLPLPLQPNKKFSIKPTPSPQVHENMAAKTPAEIGTRGTVGSLVMQEIEYFSRLELGHQVVAQKKATKCQIRESASAGGYYIPKFGSIIMTRRKKKKEGSRLLPSICSMVEVVESNRPIGKSGFSYRNLKTDVKKLQV